MIDASELPAMPSPLLKHVMLGLDKRLKEPGVSSMVHNIKPAANPVELPPPEPTQIGLNNNKFRTSLPHIEHHGTLRYPYEGMIGRPGLSNDFYTNDDGLVHFDIINQDMNGNAIDQEVPARVQPVDDANSYNKMNIMTSESPPDLNPLTVKPNISNGLEQQHVNREYSGVSVKHLLERHLNPTTKGGMTGMHVNPEPVYEKKSLSKDSNAFAQTIDHGTRESSTQIKATLEESHKDSAQYSPTFSFPGIEQLYEKGSSNIDSIQKRFAGQPPEIDIEEDLSVSENKRNYSAERSEDISHENNTTNLHLHLPSTIVDKINKQNGSKYSSVVSTQGDKATSGIRFDSLSAEHLDGSEVSKLEPLPTGSVAHNNDVQDSTDKADFAQRIDADSLESTDTDESSNVKSPGSHHNADFKNAFPSAYEIPPPVYDPGYSVSQTTGMEHGSSEGLVKNARRSESDNHKLAVEALAQMRLKNNVHMIMNSLQNDPEKVPAVHINEVLSPGTMSYTHFTNPDQNAGETNTNGQSFLTLVKNSNLGYLATTAPTIPDPMEASAGAHTKTRNENTGTQIVAEALHTSAISAQTKTGSLNAGLMDYKPVPENEDAEISAPIVVPQPALGNRRDAVVDNRMNLEHRMPGDSGATNGLGFTSGGNMANTSSAGNHELLVSAGGSLHSVSGNIFRKNSCHCGIRLSHKIVGGSVTTISEFPWMVGIAFKSTNFTFCGGTLITDRHVLTAAHCVYRYQQQPSVLYIKAGASERLNAAFTLNIKAIRVHPKYTEFKTAFDIAVVALEHPVQFSATLLPVCPPSDSEPADVYKNGVVIGWGKTDDRGTVSTQLQKTTVDLMTPAECRRQSSYDSSEINNKIICASSPGRDSCQGDSGGPLMVSNNNIIEVIGIVSWGIGCAEQQYPGVYTKIYSYRTWIKAMTRSGTKCEANPIVKSVQPENAVDYRKEHNIFNTDSDDGVELYPALRPAERFRNKYLLHFEQPKSFAFQSPIFDYDKNDEFDYVSENSKQNSGIEGESETRPQSQTRVNIFDKPPGNVLQYHEHAEDPLTFPKPGSNAETFSASEVRETSLLSNFPGNSHPSVKNRHTSGDRAVLSQSFQSTVPILYDEGEDLADIFRLVNEELTSNDERSSQYEDNDELPVSIGDRDVSSNTYMKHEETPHEAAISHLVETLTRQDQSDFKEFVKEPLEQKPSGNENQVPQLNVPVVEVMREESMNKNPEPESLTRQHLTNTTVANPSFTEHSYESLNQQDLASSRVKGTAQTVENRRTVIKTTIETSKNESLEENEHGEKIKGENQDLEAVAAVTEKQTAAVELPKEEAATDQIKIHSSSDNQLNFQLTADEKPSPKIKVDEQSNFALTGGTHGSEIPHDGLSNPVKLVTKQPKDKTEQDLSLTSATVTDKYHEKFNSKPLVNEGSAPSSMDGVTLQNHQSSQNSVYQAILDKIRAAANQRDTIGLLNSGSSSSLYTSFNDEFINSEQNSSPVVKIVTGTDLPTSGRPSSTDTSLITIADVLGQRPYPSSTPPPLDIEAIEDLIHSLGQNERKLESQYFGETLELHKRDTNLEKPDKMMEATMPVRLDKISDAFDNDFVINVNENVGTNRGNDADADLVTAILELQDELIRNLSRLQTESGMISNGTADATEGTSNTLVLGQHVIQTSKPNFLNLSTNFDATTSTSIPEEEMKSENRPPAIKLEGQSGTGEIAGMLSIGEDGQVNVATEAEKPDSIVSNSELPNEASSSILIEAHSIEIGNQNGYITFKNFTIGKPGYNFSLSFDDIDNRTAIILGEDPKKNVGNDLVITLKNLTIGNPGYNFTLDFDDIDHNVTISKTNTSYSGIQISHIENDSRDQIVKTLATPDTLSVKDKQPLRIKLNDEHIRQKGDKLTVTNTINKHTSGDNNDLLVQYVIRNSEDKSKDHVKQSTINTEPGNSGMLASTNKTMNVGGSFKESESVTNDNKGIVVSEGLRTGTGSAQTDVENVTELVLNNGNTSKIETVRRNTTVRTDTEVELVTLDENTNISEAPAEETTVVSATEVSVMSGPEEWERLRVIQQRIEQIQEEEKQEEDHSFLGMLQRHIFPASTSRRRINDKVRAYRKPEDDLNEALRKIFSHNDYYYDESDTNWGYR
ncbi:Serine proteases trypsin domain [Trinorchestia longiramus]|nr:Serine proteases trypsin domain [Trinorchestia longiramus]